MKSVKSYLYVVTLLFLASCAFGQQSEAKTEFAAKIYSESTINLDRNMTSAELFRTFSPSISWGREYGNFQEVELKDFKLSFAEGSNLFSARTEYSYNWRISKNNPQRKVNFFAGAGAGVGFASQSVDFSEFSSYASRNFNFNLVFIPRMTIDLGKRAFLDVSTPYNFYSYRNYKFNNSNAYPDDPAARAGVNANAFPNQFTVKVGVAFKF